MKVLLVAMLLQIGGVVAAMIHTEWLQHGNWRLQVVAFLAITLEIARLVVSLLPPSWWRRR